METLKIRLDSVSNRFNLLLSETCQTITNRWHVNSLIYFKRIEWLVSKITPRSPTYEQRSKNRLFRVEGDDNLSPAVILHVCCCNVGLFSCRIACFVLGYVLDCSCIVFNGAWKSWLWLILIKITLRDVVVVHLHIGWTNKLAS